MDNESGGPVLTVLPTDQTAPVLEREGIKPGLSSPKVERIVEGSDSQPANGHDGEAKVAAGTPHAQELAEQFWAAQRGGTAVAGDDLFLSRIERLEKELSEMRQKLKMDELKEAELKKAPELVTKELSTDVKRLPFDQWQPGPTFFKRDELCSNVLVVYYKKVRKTAKDQHRESDDESTSEFREVPQRVQINSRALISELSSIADHPIGTTPCVMLPPFKILVSHRDEIAEHLKTKTEEFQKMQQKQTRDDERTGEGPKTALEDEKAKKEADELKSKETAIGHLQCLLDYINGDDFKEIFELRRRIAPGAEDQLKMIAFKDLWHLFQPGDLVFTAVKPGKPYDPYTYPRVFRVHAFSGGRPRLSSKANRSSPSARHAAAEQPSEKANDKTTEKRSETEPRKPIDESSLSDVDATVYPFRVDLHYVDFDGTFIGPQSASVTGAKIKQYDGEKRIVDLDVFPVRFAEDSKKKIENFAKRGKRVVDLFASNGAHRFYDGLTTITEAEHVQGEIIIDFQTGYAQQTHGLSIGNLSLTDYQVSEIYEEGSLDMFGDRSTNNFDDNNYDRQRFIAWVQEDRLIAVHRDDLVDDVKKNDLYNVLAPRHVLGYFFRSRTWHFFNIDFVEEIDQAKRQELSHWDELVIPTDHKRLVLSLVESHQSGKDEERKKVRSKHLDASSMASNMDLVKGKGKGLVILLHGLPGVGKTLTAETVAAHTGRPLYPITCGDIGETARDVQLNLEHHFRLAHKWGCVLLLDEADVFLSERDPHGNVGRNALVSVFLRTLEYYSGILFLTTNRVGTLDEAFRSRIHIQLYYDNLSMTSTEKIWRNSLQRIRRETAEAGTAIEFDEEDIVEWALDHYQRNEEGMKIWNGRQIRNAFQTALALAVYERKKKIAEVAKKEGKSPEQVEKRKRFRVTYMRTRHFQDVDKATEEYYDYLKQTHSGLGPHEIAAQDQYRAMDPYNSEPRTPSKASRATTTPGSKKRMTSSVHSTSGKRENVFLERERNITNRARPKPKVEYKDEDYNDDDDEEEDDEEEEEIQARSKENPRKRNIEEPTTDDDHEVSD